MNGITHKQAKRHMRADLDGLLDTHQRLDLEAHLNECDACHAESEIVSFADSAPQIEFHNRWDKQNGPSTNVMANVHSQTRRIMVMNRINIGLRAVAGIAALLMLGLAINSIISQVKNISVNTNGTQVSGSTTLSNNLPLIAFVSDGIGDEEIYTMRSDGSDLKNISKTQPLISIRSGHRMELVLPL